MALTPLLPMPFVPCPSPGLPAPYCRRDPLRTSWGMFIMGQLQEHPVARHIDARISALARLACWVEGRRALVLGEVTQIVRYNPGQVIRLCA